MSTGEEKCAGAEEASGAASFAGWQAGWCETRAKQKCKISYSAMQKALYTGKSSKEYYIWYRNQAKGGMVIQRGMLALVEKAEKSVLVTSRITLNALRLLAKLAVQSAPVILKTTLNEHVRLVVRADNLSLLFAVV